MRFLLSRLPINVMRLPQNGSRQKRLQSHNNLRSGTQSAVLKIFSEIDPGFELVRLGISSNRLLLFDLGEDFISITK
jgi:hypothetical protein